MKIALLGGTGPLGLGLAARWSEVHDVIIGSRNVEKAKSACDSLRKLLPDTGANLRVHENYQAIGESDAVVLCIDYEHAISTVRELGANFEDQLVISPLAPMVGSESHFTYVRPKEGSAALQIDSILPDGAHVVSCLQGVPASKLQDFGRTLNYDVPVFADSGSGRKKAFELIRDIRYLKPLNGGPLDVAYLGEMMGVLWRNLGTLNKLKDPSFKFPE